MLRPHRHSGRAKRHAPLTSAADDTRAGPPALPSTDYLRRARAAPRIPAGTARDHPRRLPRYALASGSHSPGLRASSKAPCLCRRTRASSTSAISRSFPASSTPTRTRLRRRPPGDLRRRLAGETYAEIAASGGGIVSTVTATRAASEDELVAETPAAARRDARLRHDDVRDQERLRPDLESELKMLRAIAGSARRTRSTRRRRSWERTRFPREYRERRDELTCDSSSTR